MEVYCFIAAQYLPTMGGVENFTYNLTKELARRGHRVIIITSAKSGLADEEINEHGVEILRVPSLLMLNGRLPVVKPCKKTKALFNKLLSCGDIHMIINTRFYPLSLYAARFAKKKKINAIVLEHGSAHLSLGGGFKDFAIKIYEHIICRLVYKSCKSFYGVSKKCVDWLLHFKIKGNGVIYNAIDLKTVSETPKDYLSLNTLNVPPNARIICYVGRLIPEKGVLKLLEAFSQITADYPDAYLIFAGDGPLLARMQSTSPLHAVFAGRLSFMQVLSLFKQAELFCLPTVSEGFPTSALEAAACGCFILATITSGGATELVISDEYGALMKNNEPQTIKQALISVLNDDKKNEKAQRCKSRVEANFTWQKTADSLQNIIWQRS